MTEIRFYHLTRTTLEAALPLMLEKTLERGQRAVVMAGSQERVEALNALLWTYRRESFLPHGSASDGFADRQPIWLTAEDENPNQAQVLFLTDGATSQAAASFALCVVLFDGNDQAALAAARDHWHSFKSGGHAVTYWQQDERGRWNNQG